MIITCRLDFTLSLRSFTKDLLNAAVFHLRKQAFDLFHAVQRHAQLGQGQQRNLPGGFNAFDAPVADIAFFRSAAPGAGFGACGYGSGAAQERG